MTAPTAFLVDANSTITPRVAVLVNPSTGVPAMLTVDGAGNPITTAMGVASGAIARSAAQLAGTPSAPDIALGALGQFYDPLQTVDATHPWVYYSASATAYVKIAGTGGGTPSSTPPLALAAAAAVGTSTNYMRADAVLKLPSALDTGSIPQAGARTWDATANLAYDEHGTLIGPLTSGTPLANGPYSFRVINATSPVTIDGHSVWKNDDTIYFTIAGVYDRIAAMPLGPGLVYVDASGNPTLAVPGVHYVPGPLMRVITPFGIAPSGSVGNNGALTLGTALDQVYTNGLYLDFPAGALYAGSAAGAYWCVMSSTTVGQVYTAFIATSGSAGTTAGTILRPTSPVALSATTGPGAYTGVTSAIYFPGTNIAAGYLGKQGSVEARLIGRANTTAGGKTCGASLSNGSANININSISSTSAAQTAQVATLYLADLVNAEVAPQAQDSSAFGVAFSTLDTSVLTSVQPRLSIAVATDWVICEVFDVRAIPYPG